MRRIVAFCAALMAAASGICGPEPAFAQDDGGAKIHHVMLLSGIDLWRNGGFGHGGLLWSPDGLAQEGFTLKLLLGAGTYRYRSGATEITGRQYLASAMAGWRFKRGGVDVTLFAGPDVQHHELTPDDPGGRLRGTKVGARGGFDLWYEPLPATVMVAASVSASTIGANVWARLATGYRAFDAVWLGPEAIACGDDVYRQYRVGVHATGLRMGDLEWSLGAGWVIDSDDRSGLYGRIGMLMRR